MSDNALYGCISAAFLLGFAALVGSVAGYNASKNTVMLEMIKAGADPLKVRALMDGAQLLYVEVPAK